MQNTLQVSLTEIGIQNDLVEKGPTLSNKSIQPSVKIHMDQSAQKYNTLDAVDRSIQHTVFYADDSAQYGSSMKSKKPEMFNKSIQE